MSEVISNAFFVLLFLAPAMFLLGYTVEDVKTQKVNTGLFFLALILLLTGIFVLFNLSSV